MDIFGQTFVFFVVYDWNHTAAFASLLLGGAAIPLSGDFAAADAAVRHRHDQTRSAVEWRRIPGIVSQIGPVWVDS